MNLHRLFAGSLCLLAFSGPALAAGPEEKPAVTLAGAPQPAPEGSALQAAAIKQAIHARYPDADVQSVQKLPWAGLFEVVTRDRIFYTDEKFNFLLVGNLLESETLRNLTEARMQEMMRVRFDLLPVEHAITIVKGDGRRKLAVFSDPDCPFCKKFEQEALDRLDHVTLYIFPLPIETLHPGAIEKSRNIWCAPDRVAAWQNWMLKGVVPATADCNAPLKHWVDLGQRLRLTGTPTTVFSDGRVVSGTIPLERVEALLAPAPAAKP